MKDILDSLMLMIQNSNLDVKTAFGYVCLGFAVVMSLTSKHTWVKTAGIIACAFAIYYQFFVR